MNDGGPAFPATIAEIQGMAANSGEFGLPGMSLRDYFAAKAIHGGADVICDCLMSGNDLAGMSAQDHADQHAQAAYMLADSMLKAREQK